ncbi:MAG: FAD-binding oxidoreductase [Chloroflexota bacterium]
MTDFVIIGGGVYGCAVAWELAQQGADICLLEANTIASGASGGLGKRGVRANGRDVRELPLMCEAYDIWPTLHEQLDGPTGYERVGHLLVIEREIDLEALSPQPWVQARQGIHTHWLDQAMLREREPAISARMLAAIYCPNDGIADHTATTQSYAAAAQRLGADIREQTAVAKLQCNGDRVTAVITDKDERIPVKRGVLLASNAHAKQFVQTELGVTLPLSRMYPQVMKTIPVDPMPVRHLIGHAHRTLAMKVIDENQVMISGGWRGAVNPETGKVEPVQAQVEGNLAEAVAVYPSLAGVDVAEVSVERPEMIAYDGIPIIDTLAGAANMVVAVGWSGHGWAIAPAVARHVATWMLTGERAVILEPFQYTRFSC